MLYGIARKISVKATITERMALTIKELFQFISMPTYYKTDCPNQEEYAVSKSSVCKAKLETRNIIITSWFDSNSLMIFRKDLIQKEFQFNTQVKSTTKEKLQVGHD